MAPLGNDNAAFDGKSASRRARWFGNSFPIGTANQSRSITRTNCLAVWPTFKQFHDCCFKFLIDWSNSPFAAGIRAIADLVPRTRPLLAPRDDAPAHSAIFLWRCCHAFLPRVLSISCAAAAPESAAPSTFAPPKASPAQTKGGTPPRTRNRSGCSTDGRAYRQR